MLDLLEILTATRSRPATAPASPRLWIGDEPGGLKGATSAFENFD
jgi:hypothetical protein